MKSRLCTVTAFICSLLMTFSLSFAQDGFVNRIDFTEKVLKMSSFEIPAALDSIGFNDISNPDDMLYAAAASKYGIVQGYNQNFNPDGHITKEQALVMLVRAMDEESFANQMDDDKVDLLLDFNDSDQISPWAVHSVAYLVDKGLVESGGNLMPHSQITGDYSNEIYMKCKYYFDSKISRDGLSAALMLEKSSEKLSSYNTYKFKGTMNISTVTESPSEDDISKSEIDNLKMTLIQEGIFEKPEKVYSKSTTTIIPTTKEQEEKLQGITDQTCEIYFDGEMYIMKMPGEDFWISMDINPLIKEIQSMTGGHSIGNQALTRNQMQLFGMYSRFDDDATMNGVEYYVIDVKLDSETFNKLLQDIVNKALEYYSSEIPTESSDDNISADEIDQFKSMVSAMVSNMSIDVNYKFYVDKKTLDYRFMDIVQNIEMSIGDINSTSSSSGRFEYYDFDMPVEFPEISKDSIKTVPSLLDGTSEQIEPLPEPEAP